MSAESGVPTFRDGTDALWQGRRPEEVATPEAFTRNPEDVWSFYMARRKNLHSVRPNEGHKAIAGAQELFGDFQVITQNVDGLHQAAGSRRVLELHGSIWRARCGRCARSEEDRRTEGELPYCRCGGLMRPDVTWFGEDLPEGAMAEALATAGAVKVLIVIGTSNMVYPAASIPLAALEAGATVIEVNPQPTPLSRHVSRFIQGPAAACVPPLLHELADTFHVHA